MPLTVKSPFTPTGDQPQAIEALVEGLNDGLRFQTLLGATGTGKTYSVARVIEAVQRPALVLAPNKILTAQLAAEFREFFPDAAVEFFISYYDYYQPEAYVPARDLFIEKDANINMELERLRHSTTRSLLTRKDVIVVASVSAIYGLGSPDTYKQLNLILRTGQEIAREDILTRLVAQQYERNDIELAPGRFRAKGDVVEVWAAYEEVPLRIELWGDEIDRLALVNPVTGDPLNEVESTTIFPAKHYVTPFEQLQPAIDQIEQDLEARLTYLERAGKLIEQQRLKERTRYDLEMLRTLGYCSGIENYSRYLDGRAPGEPPHTLLDYFPDDFLVFTDESHVMVPQIRGMYNGDRSRKQTLVDYGFRLPAALDNRPLKQDEFFERVGQVIFVSATPAEQELNLSDQVVEQVIRPTGLVDPEIRVKPSRGSDRRPAVRHQGPDQAQRAGAGHHPDQKDGGGSKRILRRTGGAGTLHALGHRRPRTSSDHSRPETGALRRAGRHQPAAGGAGSARGIAGSDPRRGQDRFSAQRAEPDPDHRPRGAKRQGRGVPLRRRGQCRHARRYRRDPSPP